MTNYEISTLIVSLVSLVSLNVCLKKGKVEHAI